MKPYYEENGIQVYQGDCREILPSLFLEINGSPCIDLVLTDPPYGVQKAEWDQHVPINWLHYCGLIAKTVAVMPGIENIVTMPLTVAALPYRWTISAHIANGMTRGAFGFGNWIPCMVYSKESLNQQMQDAFTVRIHGAMPFHPCPKPFDVMMGLLKRVNAQSVLDPFMGSGTTLLAAKELGKSAIGIEIEEKYCEIAAKRLSQEVLQFA